MAVKMIYCAIYGPEGLDWPTKAYAYFCTDGVRSAYKVGGTGIWAGMVECGYTEKGPMPWDLVSPGEEGVVNVHIPTQAMATIMTVEMWIREAGFKKVELQKLMEKAMETIME